MALKPRDSRYSNIPTLISSWPESFWGQAAISGLSATVLKVY